MKIPKIIMSVLLAGSLLLAGGSAHAYVDINIWGCSAQFFLWSSMNSGSLSSGQPNFLLDSTAKGGAGCTHASWAYDSALTNYFWAQGTGCSTSLSSDGVINIRIGYKTSNDAIWAVNGVADPEAVAQGSTTGTPSYPYQCANPYQRYMPGVVTGSPPPGQPGANLNTAIGTGVTCQTVTLGASDEKANYFTQASHGLQFGPYYTKTNNSICREFGTSGYCIDGITPVEPMPTDAGLAWYNPMADPAAFYVNKAVTETTCVGGTNAGDMCAASADCTGGTCGAPATITNISRMMAAQIFTGQVTNWQDFGAGFANLPIWACMRHAGAGTNVTFDYAVLGDTHNWLPSGAAMLNTDTHTSGKTNPTAYFYDTITTQLNCVNGEISSGTYNSTGSPIGAIGYTDADKSTTIGVGTSLPNVVMVNYNGVQPSRRNIRNGLYDFWSKNYLYYNPTGANTPNTGANWHAFNALVSYANDPDKFNSLGSGSSSSYKGNFWATIPEMWYIKSGANMLPGPTNAINPRNP